MTYLLNQQEPILSATANVQVTIVSAASINLSNPTGVQAQFGAKVNVVKAAVEFY